MSGEDKEKSDVVERIRKLLALSRSPNVHEAALALSRAEEIARRNQIELGSVFNREERAGFACGVLRRPKRLSEVRKRALQVCQGFFNVTVIFSGDDVVLVGRHEDVEIARFVYEFLSGAASRAVRLSGVDGVRLRMGFVRGFFQGVVDGIRAGREKESEAGWAIVRASDDARAAYVSENFRFGEKPKVIAPKEAKVESRAELGAYYVGLERGRVTMIPRGLGSSDAVGVLEGRAA